jgi:hypothetical protein
MTKIIKFPNKGMKIEVQVVDQERIDQCASAIIVYLNGLHVSKFANWEEIANGCLVALVTATAKAGLQPDEVMDMLQSVEIKDIEDLN